MAQTADERDRDGCYECGIAHLHGRCMPSDLKRFERKRIARHLQLKASQMRSENRDDAANVLLDEAARIESEGRLMEDAARPDAHAGSDRDW